jgi:glutamate 5-kinase
MTLVVKLGSSIVAADDGELRVDVLDSVCKQVASLEQAGERVVMVTSGAIARGMRLMELPSRPKAMDELQAASAVGQGDLFRAYESRLAGHGTHAAQVLLTAADIAARTNYLNARQTLRRLIEWGVVPVVNENDTTATDEITFGDNDFLAAQVAILLDARLLVLLTNIDGLYSADPGAEPEAEMISAVGDFSELAGLEIGDRTSAFGSGGMRSKVAAAEMASESGIEAVICNGTSTGTLSAAVAGERVGTRFAAQAATASGFKLWLKYAKPARGRIVVDEGAARVLRDRGSSLLPVGIVDAEGEFDAGDAVDVAANGGVIGKGISDYSSRELNRVKGMKTEQVRDLLPHAADEVIHRDRFVLL